MTYHSTQTSSPWRRVLCVLAALLLLLSSACYAQNTQNKGLDFSSKVAALYPALEIRGSYGIARQDDNLIILLFDADDPAAKPFIFVIGKNYSTNMRILRTFAHKIGVGQGRNDGTFTSFAGQSTTAYIPRLPSRSAIIPETVGSLSTYRALQLCCRSEAKKPDLKLLGWQDTNICVRCTHKLYFQVPSVSSDSSTSNYTTSTETATFEISLDLTQDYVSLVTMRLVRGTPSASSIVHFGQVLLGAHALKNEEIMANYRNCRDVLSSYTVAQRRAARTRYNCSEMLYMDNNASTGVVVRKRIYRCGTLLALERPELPNRQDRPNFLNPDAQISVDDPNTDTTADSDTTPAEEEEEEEEEEDTGEDGQPPSFRLPKLPAIPRQPELNLTPAQALRNYLDTLKLDDPPPGTAHPTQEELKAAATQENSAFIRRQKIRSLFRGYKKITETDYFRLDNSLIVTMAANGSQGEVYLILVRSDISAADAEKTARRLANLLSPSSRVVPFAGNEPSVVIIPPQGPSRERWKYNPAHLLLNPFETCHKSTQFMGWRDGILIVRITSTTPGAEGVVEVEVDTHAEFGALNMVDLRVISGNVDIKKFLHTTPMRMWGEIAAEPTPEVRDKLKRELNCENVLYVGHGDNLNAGKGRFVLTKLSDKHYRAGSQRHQEKLKGAEFKSEPYVFPAAPLPWPKGK